MSIEHNLNSYMNHLAGEKNSSQYTLRNYRREIGEFLEFAKHKGISSWDKIDKEVVRDYLLWLNTEEYAKASVARRLSELRSFCRYLIREKVLATNPFDAVSAPKLPKRLPRFLSNDEVKALLATPPTSDPQGMRDRAILELLYATGIRVSELAGLNLADVDGTRAQIKVLGKGNKERLVLIGKPALRAVQTYIREGRPKLIGKKTSNAVFLNRFGGRLTVRSVQMTLAKYAMAGGHQGRGHAARAAPYVRHAPARRRRRPALRAGAARPRVAVDDADLHARHADQVQRSVHGQPPRREEKDED